MDIRTIVVDNTVELKEKLTKLLNEIPGVTRVFDTCVITSFQRTPYK